MKKYILSAAAALLLCSYASVAQQNENNPDAKPKKETKKDKKLNEYDVGLFEYRLSETNGAISLRSRIKLKRAFFMPDEYEMLREFFNLVVKKT